MSCWQWHFLLRNGQNLKSHKQKSGLKIVNIYIMNIYIIVVTYPIFDEKYMLLYKKLYILIFFPPRCLFFPPPRRSFYCFVWNKKHFDKILLFTSNTTILLVYFYDFFERMKNAQNISLVFCKFQMALV